MNAIPLTTPFGGLHLDPHKTDSLGQPLRILPIPAQLVVPLQQNIGQPAKPVVNMGDFVQTGQVIARADGYISAPIHAPSSGIVSAIEHHAIPHPSNLTAPCIAIDTDGRDEWVAPLPPLALDADPAAIQARARDGGLVGLGGAAFPTAVKLAANAVPNSVHPLELLIVNGAECEPYITCDEMLMTTRAAEVVVGVAFMLRALGIARALIGIEDSKPAAIRAMETAVAAAVLPPDFAITVVAVPTIYPTGGEKQLIKILTGREVPSGKLPVDIGAICHNVGTAYALFQAAVHGKPLISRLITLTGDAVNQPQVAEVRLGTRVSDLVAACGGYTPNVKRLLVGGPMMGFALLTDEIPITKGMNCLLATAQLARPPRDPDPCIRCGQCVQVCPSHLLPQQLYWHAKSREFDKLSDYHLFDCIECGCCAAVCPSQIPLVSYYRYAKGELWTKEKDKRKADLARQRHENRQTRQAKEQAEKDAKQREKKAAVKPVATHSVAKNPVLSDKTVESRETPNNQGEKA